MQDTAEFQVLRWAVKNAGIVLGDLVSALWLVLDEIPIEEWTTGQRLATNIFVDALAEAADTPAAVLRWAVGLTQLSPSNVAEYLRNYLEGEHMQWWQLDDLEYLADALQRGERDGK